MQVAAPGVTLINLPLPFALTSVNVHLVQLDDGYMLVDAGLDTEECFNALETALRESHVEWSQIRILLLTHMHPDHIGLAYRILELSKARLLMHGDEALQLNAYATGIDRAPWFSEGMHLAGTPVELQLKVDQTFLQLKRNFRVLPVDWKLSGGEAIPTAHGPLEVLWTPGHSPGHICLYSRQHRFLISGDHLLEKITPNISWQPDRDNLAEYLASLQALLPFAIDRVLPSHGQPFSGHAAWIETTTAHHKDRCNQILELATPAHSTGHAIVERMWPRRLSPFNYHFGVFEVLAHLAYMERQGRISSSVNDSGVAHWTPTR